MSENAGKARGPLRIVLITLVVLLAAVLCTAIFFLVRMITLGTPILTVEAGSPLPSAEAFFPEDKQAVRYCSNLTSVYLDKPGQYPVILSKGIWKYDGILQVADTIAPSATASDLTVISPNTVAPEDFITDIKDATEVVCRFETQPDLAVAGEQTVSLVLEDLGGNQTKLAATLTVIIDTEAPVISGVRDLLTYVGDTIAYRNGVTVSDDLDPAVTLSLDSSNVDLSTPGTYQITYSATDASGNATVRRAQVSVLEKRANHVEVDVIYAAVDALLAKFITDDMTDREKAEAIYVWTYKHMTYGGHTDTTDYIQSAYQFLTSHKGDCYGYFALQKLMFERLNIPTIDVRKVKTSPKDSNHYWLMVSIDGGKNYYHFDNVWSYHLCLVTDAYLDDFSARPTVRNAFNRDKSLYPATPTEELPNVNKLPWNDPAILKALP